MINVNERNMLKIIKYSNTICQMLNKNAIKQKIITTFKIVQVKKKAEENSTECASSVMKLI